MNNRKAFVWLVLILSLGTILRLLSFQRIHDDEIVSIRISNGLLPDIDLNTDLVSDETKSRIAESLLSGNMDLKQDFFTQKDFKKFNEVGNIMKAVVQDNGNRLLYIFSLHYWFSLFGVSMFSLKLFSLLWGLGIIVLCYFLAERITGNIPVAILSAFLAAIHPALVLFSALGLTYAMATFFTVLSVYVLLGYIEKKSSPSLFSYGLVVLACLLTHYLTIYILFLEIVFAVIIMRFNKQSFILAGTALVTFIIFLLFWYIPYASVGNTVMAFQNEYWKNFASQYADSGTINNWFPPSTAKYISVAALQAFNNYIGNALQVILQLRLVSIISLFILIPLAIFWREEKLFPSGRFYLVLILLPLSSFVFSLCLAISSGHLTPFDLKYQLFTIPLFCILLGVALMNIWQSHKLYRILLPVCISVMLVSVFICTRTAGANEKSITGDRISAMLSQNNFTILDTLVFNSWKNAALSDVFFPEQPTVIQKVDTSSSVSLYILRQDNSKIVLVP